MSANRASANAGRAPDRRFGPGLIVLVVLLICVPIAEVYLLVQVGQRIGLGWTLLLLIAEAALGGWLMRREGGKAWAALSKAYGRGRLPSGELADAALVLVGGALLMLPGFITDLFGLLFLLPFTRPLARQFLGFLIARRVAAMTVAVRQRDGVVEGEIVPDSPSDPTVVRGEVEER